MAVLEVGGSDQAEPLERGSSQILQVCGQRRTSRERGGQRPRVRSAARLRRSELPQTGVREQDQHQPGTESVLFLTRGTLLRGYRHGGLERQTGQGRLERFGEAKQSATRNCEEVLEEALDQRE